MVKSQINPVDPSTEVDTFITLKQSILTDTRNIYLISPEETIFNVLQYAESTVSVTTQPNYIARYLLYLHDKEEHYYRTYESFLDVFAKLAGVQKVLLIVVGILMKPFTKLSQQIALINESLSYGNDEKKQQRSAAVSKINQINPVKRETKDLKKLLNSKGRNQSLNCLQTLRAMLGGEKKQNLKKGIEIISNQLEIGQILSKLFEIEQLKHFLFSEDQLKLFELIPKPSLPLSKQATGTGGSLQQNPQIRYFQSPRNINEIVMEAFHSYQNLKDSQNRFDSQLINLIDQDLRDIFDNLAAEPKVSEQVLMELQPFSDGGSVE